MHSHSDDCLPGALKLWCRLCVVAGGYCNKGNCPGSPLSRLSVVVLTTLGVHAQGMEGAGDEESLKNDAHEWVYVQQLENIFATNDGKPQGT